MSGDVFFSIIIAAYNAEDTIEATVRSVLSQSFADYEIIVKDGGSQDQTLNRIPISDRIHVFSSADGGIYPGMNEGIAKASGKYLCFLNCGDVFYDEHVLARVFEIAAPLSDTRNILYGNYCRKEVLFKQPSQITPFYLYRTPLCHQSTFWGSAIFDELGGYDTSYRILADYKHTLHAFFAGAPFVYCDYPICTYLGGGASETDKGIKTKKAEYKRLKALYYKKSTRIRYQTKLLLSLRGLRKLLVSDKSPLWIRRLYRRLVNKINS